MDYYVSALLDSVKSLGSSVIGVLPKLVLAILVVWAFVFASKFVQKIVARGISKVALPVNVKGLLTTIVRILVILVGVAAGLSILNLTQAVTSILAGVGIVGLALGFAFKNIAANLISGVLLAFNKHVEIGDYICVGDYEGEIIDTDLNSITMRRPDGAIVMVPNRVVFEGIVVNFSDRPSRRIRLSLGVDYGADLKKVKDVILEAVKGLKLVNKDKRIDVMFDEFGDSAIGVKVDFWLDGNDYVDFISLRSDAIEAIRNGLSEAGIDIPYNIVVVKGDK